MQLGYKEQRYRQEVILRDKEEEIVRVALVFRPAEQLDEYLGQGQNTLTLDT